MSNLFDDIGERTWVCEKCGKKLVFLLEVRQLFDVVYRANCCEDIYTLTPFLYAYNTWDVYDFDADDGADSE